MDRYRVLYLVGRLAVTSVPLEVAGHLDFNQFDVTIVAYFRSPAVSLPVIQTPDGTVPLIEIDARNWYDVSAWRALYRLIQRYRPHLLHVNHTLPAVLGCLCGRLLNVPVIVNTEHHAHTYMGLVRSLLELVTLGLSTLVICNSNHTRCSFRAWEKRLAAHKSITVYNGVDIGHIDHSFSEPARLKAQLGIKPDKFVIGHAGRLVREKDQETLIRALAIVLDSGLDATLVIVGAGPLQQRLLALVQALGIDNQVIFTGEVARSRAYQILYALDLFIMSSITEGFSNAVVEAMAARRAVVVTRAGALPEIVGKAGRLAPPRSPAALAAAILEVAALGSTELEATIEAGRRRAEICFTIQRTGAEYSRLYLAMLRQKEST